MTGFTGEGLADEFYKVWRCNGVEISRSLTRRTIGFGFIFKIPVVPDSLS